MTEGERRLTEQSDVLPGELTQEQILAAYERGPEAVLAMFAQLQASVASVEQSSATAVAGPENVGQDGIQPHASLMPDEFDQVLSGSTDEASAETDFDKFLAYLSPDRDEAARLYNDHLNALTRYFISHQAYDPHGCAVRVMEILQKQIGAGRQIEDFNKYRFGVARFVLRKDWTNRSKVADLQERPDDKTSSPLAALEQAAREKCMATCLQALPSDKREKVVDYYSGNKQDKERREALAKRSGVTPNALSTDIHRITGKLRKCLEDCLKKSASRM